jgi:hypothetical protein
MDKFIAEVDLYAAACGVKPTTIVQRAAGVSGAAWRNWTQLGGSCTMATADRVRAYMRANPAPATISPTPPQAEDAA